MITCVRFASNILYSQYSIPLLSKAPVPFCIINTFTYFLFPGCLVHRERSNDGWPSYITGKQILWRMVRLRRFNCTNWLQQVIGQWFTSNLFNSYNTRKLDELPFQHYHLSRDDPESFATRPYFTDLSWVHDKLAATDCGHFLEDIALVHVDPLPEHIEILKEV